jgi:hypothetical protein
MRRWPAKTLQKQVDTWNSRHRVGTSVQYRKDDQSIVTTKTRSEAYVLSGHTSVILVEGIDGCVALERVSPIEPQP